MKRFILNSLPELVTIIVLVMLFAWTYMLSVTHKTSGSNKMAAQTTPATETSTTRSIKLTLSPQLAHQAEQNGAGSHVEQKDGVVDTKRYTDKNTSAAVKGQKYTTPAWPAALFTLAFLSGWLVRHVVRTRHYNAFRRSYDTDHEPDTRQNGIANTERSELYIAQLDHRIESLQRELMTLADVDNAQKISGGSTAAEIEILRKKNVAKAEIIMALEDLVKENRENWLLRDETEERMNRRIKELTEDLNAAMSLMHKESQKKDDEIDAKGEQAQT